MRFSNDQLDNTKAENEEMIYRGVDKGDARSKWFLFLYFSISKALDTKKNVNDYFWECILFYFLYRYNPYFLTRPRKGVKKKFPPKNVEHAHGHE